MAAVGATAEREMIMTANVIRCGCGEPDAHYGLPCPRGRVIALGTIGYWHPSRFRRLKHKLMALLTRGRNHARPDMAGEGK